MLVSYLIELIDKWEAEGVPENEMVDRLLTRWPTLDEKAIRGIINYK